MKENGFSTRVDRYLRREDTPLAKTLKIISPKEGCEYRNPDCMEKRIGELVIATPLAVAATPIIGILAGLNKIDNGGNVFYVHERVGLEGKPVNVLKIRSMKEGSDNDSNIVLENLIKYKTEDDPRNTRLGSFMRKFDLDELPQLWQVVFGKMSLVSLRAVPKYFINHLKEERPRTSSGWEKKYYAGKPGIFNLQRIMKERKDDNKRYHYDMLYARKASLGLDFYIDLRTGVRMINKIKNHFKESTHSLRETQNVNNLSSN